MRRGLGYAKTQASGFDPGGGRGHQAGFVVGVSWVCYLIHLLKPELAARWLVES